MIDRAIALRVFPRDDAAFGADADAAMRAATSAECPAARAARALPGRDRPPARGHRRPRLRAGRVVRLPLRQRRGPVGRWWTEESHPWAVLDDQRRFVDLSSSLAAIVEAPSR
jgi:hypothetical protein